MKTHQLKTWTGRFGKLYTDRNTLSLRDLDALYKKQFSTTRTDLNKRFLGKLPKSARILEVGCNTGNQLLLLQKMGYKNLYGIEPQEYAVECARQRCKGINIIRASAFDLPFRDGYFDVVFTSGVLIHINPADIHEALAEIYRTSCRFVWGYEYYAPEYNPVAYRGRRDLLWKTDFERLYLDTFESLHTVKVEYLDYRDGNNRDVMFLLEKGGGR
jgi:pseudaminic acid biosynthesis-associated methylase